MNATQEKTQRQKDICQTFAVPDFLEPWLDRFFEPEEFDLILALTGNGMILNESIEKSLFPAFERAYRRGILNKDMDGNFELADFHARFEIWALFEGWKDIPPDVRQQLNAWELMHYEDRKRGLVEDLKQGHITEERNEYLLLHEAEAFLDKAEHIYLWPCNCRAMLQQCAKPVNVCLRFNNDRGIGWEISAERAKEITREANRQGLMQLAEYNKSAEYGKSAECGKSAEYSKSTDNGSVAVGMCNCCADCCYPHVLAERLNSQKIWPTSRYVAAHHSEQCSYCGKCARRCPFQAFEQSGDDQSPKDIIFNADRCRGCGVCATGCPEMAIDMIPL